MRFNLCLSIALLISLSTFAVLESPSTAQAQSVSASQPVSRDSMPLKPGDRLRLTVVGFPDISGEQTVMADGGVQIPLAGYVNVWGLTPNQAADAITSALIPYVRRPRVSLAIESLSPTRVSVTGEVNRAGPIILDTPTDSLHGESTLSEALRLAGGITPNADLRNIVIRRHIYGYRDSVSSIASTGELSSEDSPPTEEIKVDLLQSIREGNLSADIPVYHGDEIIIPVSAQITGADQQTLLSSTIAPNRIQVNVGGQVNRPGILEVPPNSSLSSAVAAAGGLTRDGTAKNIVIFRTLSDGSTTSYVYDLGEDAIALRNGDAIIVSQSNRSEVERFIGVLGGILSPFSGILNLLN